MTRAFKVEVSAIRTFIATIWKSNYSKSYFFIFGSPPLNQTTCSTRDFNTRLDDSARASGETDDIVQIFHLILDQFDSS